MRVLEHIAVILLTTLVVVTCMIGWGVYMEQDRLIKSYEAQMQAMAYACQIQVVPQSGLLSGI